MRSECWTGRSRSLRRVPRMRIARAIEIRALARRRTGLKTVCTCASTLASCKTRIFLTGRIVPDSKRPPISRRPLTVGGGGGELWSRGQKSDRKAGFGRAPSPSYAYGVSCRVRLERVRLLARFARFTPAFGSPVPLMSRVRLVFSCKSRVPPAAIEVKAGADSTGVKFRSNRNCNHA
jgi:hypothetical protein